MNKDQIHNLFSQAYDSTQWKEFLSIFFHAQFYFNPEVLNGIDDRISLKVLKLGYINLNENQIERKILIYEVTLAPGIILERYRVGLRNLLRKHWKNIDAAFVVYHNPESKKWYFSYISQLTGYDFKGNFQIPQTVPKRYTYVFGDGENILTAIERFTHLVKKNKPITPENIKEAFSVEKLSKDFFSGFKNHYTAFCNFVLNQSNIKTDIFNDDDKAIRDFIKRLLGRIVFLYFIQKNGWMAVPVKEEWGQGNIHFLSSLFTEYPDKEHFYSDILTRIFFDTLNTKRENDIIELFKGYTYRIPYLNGGLFENNNENYQSIQFEPHLFQGLFDYLDQFNFTIYEDDPIDHTIAVDPEMLGHIFESLLEDNRDKGAFYTPKEIVHYMCQESLIEYLCTKLSIDHSNDRDAIQYFIENKEIDIRLADKVKHIHLYLDTVKICDPSIGSGAFPMGLLQEILAAKQALWYYEYGDWKNFPFYEVKFNIIQNSIFGVDLEQGAVDIARLRFWLSLVIDKNESQPLPNLDYKIVVGNSLVSKIGNIVLDINRQNSETKTELFNQSIIYKKGKILTLIAQKQTEFFRSEGDKKQLTEEIRNLKIDLIINQLELKIKTDGIETQSVGTGKIIAQKNDRYRETLNWKKKIEELKWLKKNSNPSIAKTDFFDWELDFPEVFNVNLNPIPGFDIVIGNPPYIQLQKNKGKLADSYEKLKYQTFTRMGDIYCLFYEKGWQILKPKGLLCFITSNKWMRTGYGEKLRHFFVSHCNPLQLIDFCGTQIFDLATVDTNILIFQKDTNQNKVVAANIGSNYDTNTGIRGSIAKNYCIKSDFSKEPWVIGDEIHTLIKPKIISMGTPLIHWDISIDYGIKTGYNEAFIIDTEKKEELISEDPRSIEIIKPVLRGRDIKKWKSLWADLWLITTFPAKKINIDNYPAVKKYLESFGRKLYQTGETYMDDQGNNAKTRKKSFNQWFETQDQISYFRKFEYPKIIYPDMTSSLPFAYDETGIYTNQKCYIITGKNLKYLIGLLNSHLFKVCFRDNFPDLGAEGRILTKMYFEKLPLLMSNTSSIKKIECIVDNILCSPEHNIPILENQLNKEIYNIYGLSGEEIQLINAAILPHNSIQKQK